MKQIYHRYDIWEDFQNGMYSTDLNNNEEELIRKAVLLLSNKKMFDIKCSEVIKKWVISSEVNLTNKQTNRQSWLGQAACCYTHGVPEKLTRIAWGKLNEFNKKQANLIADKHINKYEREYFKIHKNLGEQMLF